jgi:acyl-CoA reductase-like NAD-dependent aldehyde dehydrogenase
MSRLGHMKISKRHLSIFKDKYGGFVNGKEIFPVNSKYFDVHAPATGLKLTSVAAFDKDAVNSAIDIAHNTHESGIWAKADVRERAKVLNKIAENLRNDIPRLADMEVAQTGRAVREMKAQVIY